MTLVKLRSLMAGRKMKLNTVENVPRLNLSVALNRTKLRKFPRTTYAQNLNRTIQRNKIMLPPKTVKID